MAITPNAWMLHSAELARWAMARFVNRTDVWGAYLLSCYRTPDNDGKPRSSITRTAPARCNRGKVLLTLDILARHFIGEDAGHVIGVHSTSPRNTSLWGSLDIDWHSECSSDPQTNLRAATSWYQELRLLGFRPLLTDSNGRGGYHLVTIFNEPVPTPTVFAFLHWLTSDYAKHGLPARPEHFPKQPRIAEGKYGNWVRVPGRHHTRDHWSKVWNGECWLDDAAAVEFILGLQGDPPALIPTEVEAVRVPQARLASVVRPLAGPMREDRLARRIQRYMIRLPNLAEGYGRDRVAYSFAAFLVRDLQLADDAALPWLQEWDAGNSPPKGDDRLREIIKNTHQYGTHAYGSGLHQRPVFGQRQSSRVSFSMEIS
jgi:hypothetical protein